MSPRKPRENVSLPRENVKSASAAFQIIRDIIDTPKVPAKLRARVEAVAVRGQTALAIRESHVYRQARLSGYIRLVVENMISQAGAAPFPSAIRKRWIEAGLPNLPSARTIRGHLHDIQTGKVRGKPYGI